MGLFGKIFEKKSCDICGGEIGLLGNRKLEDGNLCKECAKKLSPFFSERRRSTVEQIREQLDYREANKDRVAGFNTFTGAATPLTTSRTSCGQASTQMPQPMHSSASITG